MTVAELTAALVRIPTTEPSPTRPAVALCGEWLQQAGFRLRQQVETAPGIVHALYERDGDGPPLLFDGHLDTVPAGGGWERDPLGGEIADGAVWGRGAADDKGPIAALLVALQRHAGARRLLVSLCGDEELHMRGIKALREDPAVQAATQAIALEPTGLIPIHAHKGNARVRVDVSGRPAHSSRPWAGCNAIEEKMRLITAVAEWFAVNEGARRVADFGDEPSTLVVTRELTPNTAFNVIPDRAGYWYNFRDLPGQEHSLETLLAQIAAQAERLGIQAKAEVEYASPPTYTPVDAPLVRALSDIGGHAPAWEAYGTDGGWLSDGQREVVVFGPGDVLRAHRANEMITVEELEAGVAALRKVLQQLG
ncbi:MAG: M20 family metallopeptidase [Armatimonadota bacterium]